MTTGHVFVATSLDGFIARTDHQLDWLIKQDTGGEDLGYDDFIKSVDGIIMGRGSFGNVQTLGSWPYDIPVIVMSATLSHDNIPVDIKDKITISKLSPAELMVEVSNNGWSRAYIDGGKIVQSFIRLGLIEDIILTSIPILIGDGLRLFGEIYSDIDLDLIASESFHSGLVQNHYKLV